MVATYSAEFAIDGALGDEDVVGEGEDLVDCLRWSDFIRGFLPIIVGHATVADGDKNSFVAIQSRLLL